jgi:hypothetical protein
MTTEEKPARSRVRVARLLKGCSLATLAVLLVAIGSCAATVKGFVVVDGANGPVGPPIVLGPGGSFTVPALLPGSYLVRYGTEEREIASKRVTAPAANVVIEVP